MKQEQIPEENLIQHAKEESLHIFPDNPIASNLVEKSILGQISEEEEELLVRYIEEKQYSPEVNELFRLSREDNPKTTKVEVNHGSSIKVSPEDEEQTIWTYGLGKCNATITYTENKDGSREAVLTHFFPDKIQEHAGILSELLSKIKNEDTVKNKSFIFSLGKEEKEGELSLQNREKAETLSMIIHSRLPKEEIETIPYPEFKHRLTGPKDQGVLMVKIPGKNHGEATIQTWFAHEKLI